MAKTPKPKEDTPKSNQEIIAGENEALAQKVEELNTELNTELIPLRNANAELTEENERVNSNIANIKTANDELVTQVQSLKDNIEAYGVTERINLETIAKLAAELDAAKLDKLPQAIRLDVLCAAAFQRSPNCNPTNAAKLATEQHDALIAICRKRADNATQD